MEKKEERPDTDPNEEAGPEAEGGPAEPAEAKPTEASPPEAKRPKAAAQAKAPAERGPGGSPQYLLTAAITAVVLVLGAALFAVGFWTHSLVEDDVDLKPIEDRLVALEESTGSIEDILSGAVGGGNGDGDQTSPEAATSVNSEDDATWGPEDASVVMVEFSDFQCSFCNRFATETLPLIREAYGDQVRFIFRDFPLSQIHPDAQKAAEAAQCAQEQGQFWEYHDLLFENQGALDVANLKGYGEEVGLDTGEFNDCLDSGKNEQEVAQDLDDGRDAGISGTPGFIVNGLLVSGAQPFEQFQAILDQLLAAEE